MAEDVLMTALAETDTDDVAGILAVQFAYVAAVTLTDEDAGMVIEMSRTVVAEAATDDVADTAAAVR